jgi:hypothetical protein
MRHPLRHYRKCAVAVAGAGLLAVTPLAPAPDVVVRAVQLTSVDPGDSPLGDSAAFIMGATAFPTPSQGWVDAIDALYLQPRGLTGAAQPLTTPESLYALTGPFSQSFDASTAQGAQIVADTVHDQLAQGGVDAANPLVFTGYSQGSAVAALAMSQLADAGVPSEDVHFVLLGDPKVPNGGYLERFDLPAGTHPTAPSLGVTFSGGEPSDLYPTDVYTMEYDGFADFPQYPLNFLSDLNAYLGIVFNHLQYLGFTPEQIDDAVALPTSTADTLTDYYMVPSESLPLLDPLRLIPFAGNPLADLLQPDLRVLVNLGYGSITDGWSPGPADVDTPMGLLPPLSVLEQAPQALGDGLVQGVRDALADLQNPDNYQVIAPETMDSFLGPLLRSGQAEFWWPGASMADVVDNIVGSDGLIGGVLTNITSGLGELSLSPLHTGIPAIDVAATFLSTIPEVNAQIFADQLADGNLLEAIGDPIAFDVGVTPLLLVMALI